MSLTYGRFLIHVGEAAGGKFPALAELHSDWKTGSWPGKIPEDLPLLTREEVQWSHLLLIKGYLAGGEGQGASRQIGRPSRPVHSPGMVGNAGLEYLKDFGSRLFHTLFSDQILQGFHDTIAGMPPGYGLRVVLALPPALESLPWEFLYDAYAGLNFFARSVRTPLARHLSGFTTASSFPVERSGREAPLRVLVVSASPQGTLKLSSEKETLAIVHSGDFQPGGLLQRIPAAVRLLWRSRSIRETVESWRQARLFQVEVLEAATLAELQNRLAKAREDHKDFEVVHFIGHGAVEAGQSQLLFEKGTDRQPDPVPSEVFAETVGDPPGTKLVFLNACETAAPGPLFQNVAEATLQKGIPAVIGMQVPIRDRTAVQFAREFYGYWAGGEPVESALALARRAVRPQASTQGGEVSEWGIPVLYMAPLDGLAIRRPLTAEPLPRRFSKALYLLLAVLIPLAITYYQFLAPLLPARLARMDHQFNIALADFGVTETGEGSPVRRSQDGDDLSAIAFQELDALLAGDPALKDFVGLEGRRIRPLSGRTTAERQLQAAELAQKINADIVVYGNVDLSQEPDLVRPEFYISPRLAGAEEATGAGSFGAPVEVILPLNNQPERRAYLTKEFLPRLHTLAEFLWGLAYYKSGQLGPALRLLDTARLKLESQEAQAQMLDPQGEARAVLYLWIGAAEANLALQGGEIVENGCPVQGVESVAGWECAQAAFDRSLALQEGRFARAYIGRGNLLSDQACQERFGSLVCDCSLYDQAAEEYAQAQEPGMEALESAAIELKVAYNTGTAYATAFRNGCGERYGSLAVDHLTRTVKVYQADTDSLLGRELAAKAFYQIGTVQRRAGRLQDALAAFEQAMQLSETRSRQALENEPWKEMYWNAGVQKGHTDLWLAETGKSGYLEQAQRDFQAVIATFRTSDFTDVLVLGDAQYGLGVTYNRLGQPEKAIPALENSIRIVARLRSEGETATEDLPGSAYLELGKARAALAPAQGEQLWQQALEAYGAALDQIRTGAVAAELYYQSGLAWEALGAVERARESFTVSLSTPGAAPAILAAAQAGLDRLGK